MSNNKIQHKTLKIGQVVYILSNKGQSILPAMVVEENIIQTLQGKNVSWKLALGAGEKQRILESTKINGEIFTDLGEVKKLLTQRLTDFINKVVNEAQRRQEIWYGRQLKMVEEAAPKPKQSSDKIDPETLIEELGELPQMNEAPNEAPAEPASINTTQTQQYTANEYSRAKNLQPEVQQKVLRNQLKDMLKPEEEEERVNVIDNTSARPPEPQQTKQEPGVESKATFTDASGRKHELDFKV